MIREHGFLMVIITGILMEIIGHLTQKTKAIGLIGINNILMEKEKDTQRNQRNHGQARRKSHMGINLQKTRIKSLSVMMVVRGL